MKESGIDDGDLLVVDKSLNPKNDDLAICVINGEFTIMRIFRKDNELYLKPETFGSGAGLIKIQDEGNAYVWGIITYSIHKT
jgi:DNA polymerase V